MKKFLTILLIVTLVLTLTACTKEKEEKKSDAQKFKEEYESLNGKKNEDGKTIRTIKISKDNPFVYTTAEDISKMMDEEESFVVYFGFAECPWCRSMIEQLIKSAQDNNIDKIYYVDVQGIRDKYDLNEEMVAEKTFSGTPGYEELIKKMENVLSDYYLSDLDGNRIEVNEKRIYAPNVVAVVNGKAEKLVEGYSEKLEDPYSELTDEMIEESYNSFKCLWKCLDEGATVCQKNSC